MCENIFNKLQFFLKDTISVDVINILLRSGFDSKLSLSSLNTDTINEIEQYAKENRSVLEGTSYQNVETFKFKPGHRAILLQLANQVQNFEEAEEDVKKQLKMSEFSLVLKTFIETAELNHGRHPNGFRYNEINRYFSTFVYLLCGRACYDTLCANLPIPQANTVQAYINQNKPRIIEGQLRCEELNAYLDGLKLDKYVWISEDASGIINKIEFDPNTNQMVGLVLPMTRNTGMPIAYTYLARSSEEIEKNMKKKMSSSAYIVMAQPLKRGVPPFILQLYGTDNTFTTQNVLLRWKHTIKELER